MALFCMTMAVLYTLCAENSVPVTDAIFGVRARTRAQPRAHTIVKVCIYSPFITRGSIYFPCMFQSTHSQFKFKSRYTKEQQNAT